MGLKILIPTDFTIESLVMVKKALKDHENSTIRLVLVHGFLLPSSITELLFFSAEEQIEKLSGPGFKEAMSILENKYHKQVGKPEIKLFTGFTQAAFQNFITGNGIDKAYLPAEYKLMCTGKNSFDPTGFIKNSQLPTTIVSWAERHNLPERDKVAELFLD